MSRRSRKPAPKPDSALFNDPAYRRQLGLARQAEAFLAAAGDDPADFRLIGAPEYRSRRGSNRSEITPPTMYWHVRDALPIADAETVVTLDGETMSAEEWRALNASPSIDHVTQHATTANRDRRLMSAPTYSARYVPPCHPIPGPTVDGKVLHARCKVSRSGRMTWTLCAADHRHIETGRTYITARLPYGADGADRGTVTLRAERKVTVPGGTTAALVGDGTLTFPDRTVTLPALTVPASKRQGRRTRVQAVATTTDAVMPASGHTAAYAVKIPRVTTTTAAPEWTVATAVGRTRDHETRTDYPHSPVLLAIALESIAADSLHRDREISPHVDGAGEWHRTATATGSHASDALSAMVARSTVVPALPVYPDSGPAVIPAWDDPRERIAVEWETVTVERDAIGPEHRCAEWKVAKPRQDRPGAPRKPIDGTSNRETLRRRLMADPDTVALAARLESAVALLDGERTSHRDGAWSLHYRPAQGGASLMVAYRGREVAVGSWRGRKAVIRSAIAAAVA